MKSVFAEYASAATSLPAENWGWNLYGRGLEQIGNRGAPEDLGVPSPRDDQLLVRVDAVSLCFSDVKLIQQGGSHPKLYGRDLAREPTRLGHEASLTVIDVGADLRNRYAPGERLAIQPDIYHGGRSTAYGYTVPGGLIQFHLIGPEVLAGDHGSYLLPVPGELGYAEAALTEPWACVEGAYRQRRRLRPAKGGTMWIVGTPGDSVPYRFSEGLHAPSTIVLTDAPAAVRALVRSTSSAEVVERDGLTCGAYAALAAEITGSHGFDDIVLLDPRSAEAVGEAARLVARRGTLNLVGRTPLNGLSQIDVGRLHYDYVALLGSSGPDISTAYGEAHNRSDLKPDGVAVFIGAGGPMGQMHIQRALEMPGGPRLLIATEPNAERRAVLERRFQPLATGKARRLVTTEPRRAAEVLRQEGGGEGADDVIVSVPSAEVITEAATLLSPNGMLVLFAGVPNGTFAPLDLSRVYRHNAQFTGTSGSTTDDQRIVIQKAAAGDLSPNRSVAAVGGMEAARDGLEAMMAGRYPGKIVIFPQLRGLPLIGLPELAAAHPDVGARLGPYHLWTPEAERALIEKFWPA